MPPLSVVVITYNEEHNIRAALESARFADELVVLDSFSTDKTADICRQYTDRFYQEGWRGFSGQTSRAVELASNDWVFVLDADERITDPLAYEIRALMDNGPDKDGDTDDSAAKAVQAAPSPTVNTNGQTVGQIINVPA